MSLSASDLQIKELKDTITKLNKTLDVMNESVMMLQKQLSDKDKLEQEHLNLIKNLKSEIEYLKHKLFGSSSEKTRFDPDQMGMFEIPEEDLPKAEEVEAEYVTKEAIKKERKHKATYDDIFSGIKHTVVNIDNLTEEEKKCPVCGSDLVPIGQELIRTELIYHPAKLERIDYMGINYGCPKCKEDATEVGDNYIVKSKAFPALIPGGYASESIAAWTIYQKFCNSMPFYRQVKDMEQYGVKLTRTTLASWAIYCAKEYYKPMYDFFHDELVKRKFIMADETTIQVLKEPDRRPETKSYMWLIRTGEDGLPKIVYYRYTPTRAGTNAAEILDGIPKGTYMMVDGYQGYNKVPDVKLCYCWAHVRRYILDAVPKGHENDYTDPAVQGVLYINKLFEYERRYREKGLSYEKRYQRRLKDEKPILEAFWLWYEKLNPIKGSRLDRAYVYIGNRRKNLETYLEDGRCSFSNNLTENLARPITIGRKNYLFSDSVDGADTNAIMYTMVEMAKAYDINVYAYLKFLLSSRPNEDMDKEELEKLAPWNESVQEACKKESIQ